MRRGSGDAGSGQVGGDNRGEHLHGIDGGDERRKVKSSGKEVGVGECSRGMDTLPKKKEVSARCRNVIMGHKTCLFLVDQSDECSHCAGNHILVCLPSRLNGNVLIFLLDVLSEPFADGHLQRSLGSLAPSISPVPLGNRSLAPSNSNTRTAGTST